MTSEANNGPSNQPFQQVVVITGSTRGIGYGLAADFLQLGCAVIVNGRSQASVERAVAALAAPHSEQCLLGCAGDMTVADQVQALWNAAYAKFGRIDIWINNAGLESRRVPFWELTPDELQAVVATNLTGVMYGCRVAIQGMKAQGGGHIYNMEGFGSEGRMAPGLTAYGVTKYGLHYLTKALVAETADLPVRISTINPGMVITDMLMDNIPPGREAETKRIYNILADRVETVTPTLARRILANQTTGARIEWLSTPQIIARFVLARFRKRDLFAEDKPA